MKFLQNHGAIRNALTDLCKGTANLDLAVAFIGEDWKEILSDFPGDLRVVCWLSSTNTNPHAVQQMMRRPRTEVKQRHSMHCKVYLAPGVGAIAGSANLSGAALAESDNAGQDEAAMLLTEKPVLEDIVRWFEELWKDGQKTRSIRASDLSVAKEKWDQARKNRAMQAPIRANASRGIVVAQRAEAASSQIDIDQSRIRRNWMEEEYGEALKVVDEFSELLKRIDGSLRFHLKGSGSGRYAIPGPEGGPPFVDSPRGRDQSLCLTLNKGETVRLTALRGDPKSDVEWWERRLEPLLPAIGCKLLLGGDKPRAVRVGEIKVSALENPGFREPLVELMRECMAVLREDRKR